MTIEPKIPGAVIPRGVFTQSGSKAAVQGCSTPLRHSPQYPGKQTIQGRTSLALECRFCCKSHFALVIKNSFGRRRDFRVKMWGTSSPEDKLTGDLDNVIEATSIGGRRVRFFYSRKISAGQFGTFATISAMTGLMHCNNRLFHSISSSASASTLGGMSRRSSFAVFRLCLNRVTRPPPSHFQGGASWPRGGEDRQ
jgi:hypothetical protein